MASDDLKPIIAKLADRTNLDQSQAAAAFEVLMSGEASEAQIGALLMGLRMKGETADEIAGAVTIMRSKMTRIDAPLGAMDIVGTGGDGSGTYNISTATAIVVASCGVAVAKHGNRAASSKSGTADALSALGVNLDADFETVSKAIHEAGIGFMFAQRHHAAMKHVMPTRVQMGTRTIFNLLGPLSNPAGVKRILLGVFAPQWVEPMAHALAKLDIDFAWVVHGDGLDELSTTGKNMVAQVAGDEITHFELSVEDFGLPSAQLKDLKGADAQYNADALSALLDGKQNAYRDIVLMNSAAALKISGKVTDLKSGVAMAAEHIDNGKAKQTLADLVAITND